MSTRPRCRAGNADCCRCPGNSRPPPGDCSPSVPDPAQDAALKRLVESSARKVHLICDRTHRLLAASSARQAEWQADPAQLLGQSLIGYASLEILAAEATLDALGWHDGHLSCLTVETGANTNPQVPIVPGRALWERIMLADGSAGRLVTTLA